MANSQKTALSQIMQFVLLLVFFFSGISALIYQIVWIRQFGLVFGVDIFSTSTVLAAFMAGLALGSLLFGRLVDRRKHVLMLFVLLQLGIGVFALVFPVTFQWLNQLYLKLDQVLAVGFYGTQIYRFGLAFLFLLFPTTLMGGTLPVLTKVFVRKLRSLGWNVGKLYSVNNLGAFVGCFLAGFLLMRWVGLRHSILIAAALNLASAVIVFVLSKVEKRQTHPEPAEPEVLISAHQSDILPTWLIRLVLITFAIEGFTTLAYEVIWTRILLGFSYDKSVYFYTTVILSFIFGLSVGSFLIAKVTDIRKNLLALFAGIELAIGILAILLLSVFAGFADILIEWRMNYGDSWWASLGKEYLIFFVAMLLPTTLMGMTFPIVSKICTPHLKRLGTRIGEIGFLDTVGSILGAFVAGFILIPFLGVIKAVILTALINIGIGLLLIVLHPHLRRRSKLSFVAGMAIIFTVLMIYLPGAEYFQYWQTQRLSDRLLYYNEGADATIAVPQHADGTKFLAINGSVTAFANFGDIRVHKMLGYLPYLLHEEPEHSLVIGLGMGITAQSLLQPGMQRVDCVEINRGVVEASLAYFDAENNDALLQDRVNVIVDDGRSYLQTKDQTYDIITSNAVHARLSGNLYTREFYEICKERLTPNGVMCQWTSTNWLTPREFKSLITAFQEVFPNTSIWLVNAGHALMVGTPEPLNISYTEWQQRLSTSKARADLAEYSLGSPEIMMAHFIADQETLPLFLQNARPNTDDFPYAELSRVVSKIQIPEVVLGFIRLKRDLTHRLTFKYENLQEMVDIKERVSRYAEAETYYLQGVFSQNFAGEPLLALNMLTEALNLQPNDYRYHEEAASINLFLAQQTTLSDSETRTFLENTVEHLEAMVGEYPNFPQDWTNLGFVYMNRGDLEQAKEAFYRAIDLAPELPMPRVYLASILGGEGYLDEAEQQLLTAVKHFPDEIEAYYRLGLVYELKRQPEEARQAYQEVVHRQETYRDAFQRLRRLRTAG